MIVNLFSITILFTALLSFVLISWAGITSWSLIIKYRGSVEAERITELEDRSYLVLLIASVILIIRLFNWPLFYFMLHSFIPEIPGAMCIFGTTQILPTLTKFLEILKPVTFFLIGSWLVLHMLDRSAKTAPLMKRKLAFLGIVFLPIAADSVSDMVFIIKLAPGFLVSCCTTVSDALTRATKLLPASILGDSYRTPLILTYLSSNVLLITATGLLGLIFRQYAAKVELESSPTLTSPILKQSKNFDPNPRWYAWRKPILTILFFWGLASAAVTLLAFIEVIAPRLMELPYHHCLYCFLQNVWSAPVIVSTFIWGTLAIGWALVTQVLGNHDETAHVINGYTAKLLKSSFLTLGISLLLVAIGYALLVL